MLEVKWYHCVTLVEANSHLKLLPTSIFDKYRVFEHHTNMLSIGIW